MLSISIMVTRFSPFLACWLGFGVPSIAAPSQQWPSFRGPRASGVMEGFSTAVEWNVEKQENIAWKAPISGLGHSSPAIWDQRIFITTAVRKNGPSELKVGLYGDIEPINDATEHTWKLYCLDQKSGKVLWEQAVLAGVPKLQRHPKSSHANSTPAADGLHVVTLFGSEGLYCYAAEGNLLWKKDLGSLDSGYYMVPEAQWGFGSSPVIHKDKVIVQCDVQKGSFLAVFSLKDGAEVWRRSRVEVPTWSTPAVHEIGGKAQIIVNGYRHLGGYDLATGEEVWKMSGGGDIPVPTPIFAHGFFFITNAHGGRAPIYAIRAAAKGDITGRGQETSSEHVAWSLDRRGNYMQTPLVYGEYLYCCHDTGVLSCFEAKTGSQLYRRRLGGGRSGFTASPVAAAGKLYFTSEDGDVYVVQAGPEFKLLATNTLGETCMATPAISEGTLFFRTRGHVVAVAERGKKPSPDTKRKP